MGSKIINNHNGMLTIEMSFALGGSMLEMENAIQDELNKAGCLATAEALKTFDTNGDPISIAGVNLTARKEKIGQSYETPYGRIRVERFLYQSNDGGYTYCPLEDDARIFLTSTPRFAQMVSSDYAQMGASDTVRNLMTHNRRKIDPSYVANVSEAVATVAQIKEDKWEYDIPKLDVPVTNIGIGVDATCMLLCGGGWRHAMCGTIALYDKEGNRLHTAYIAAPPEYGKEKFHAKMDHEINRVRERFPEARMTGIGDGAADNWTYLRRHTDNLVLDFWHVSEYVHAASNAYWGFSENWAVSKQAWEEEWFHTLKHRSGGASLLIDELKIMKAELSGKKAQTVQKTIGYMENHLEMMKYSREMWHHSPIGSGVTEAACKMLVKQRLGVSGAGWSLTGAGVVLTLRSLYKSDGHWNSFWSKVSRYGVPGSRAFGDLSAAGITHNAT